MPVFRAALLPLLAAGTLGAWVGVALAGPARTAPLGIGLLYAAAFGVYVAAVTLVVRGSASRWALALILLTGFAARLAVIGCEPSDDVNRYLWEAEVMSAGMNPYALAPDAPELLRLASASDWHEGVNHKQWTAIYPPAMLGWQWLLGWSTVALKAYFFLAAEALLLLVLWLLLRVRGADPGRLLIYAWNPLVIFMVAHQGHHDVVATALLFTALALSLVRRTRLAAGPVFAGAVLMKGFALAVLPALYRRLPFAAWLLAAGTAALLYLPFLDAGGEVFGSLGRFGAGMSGNDSVYAVLWRALAEAGFGGATGAAAKVLCLAGLLALAVYVVTRVEDDLLRRAAWLSAGLLLFLPTAHPWYFTLVVPFLVFFPWWGWVAFTGTAFLPQVALLEMWRTGVVREWTWMRPVEYSPLLVFALLWLWRRRQSPSDAIPNVSSISG